MNIKEMIDEHNDYSAWSSTALKHLESMFDCTEGLEIDDYDKEWILSYDVNIAEGFAIRYHNMGSFILRFVFEVTAYYDCNSFPEAAQGATTEYYQWRRDNIQELFVDSESLLHSLVDGFEVWYLHELRTREDFETMDVETRAHVRKNLSIDMD